MENDVFQHIEPTIDAVGVFPMGDTPTPNAIRHPYLSATEKAGYEEQIPIRIRPFLEVHAENLQDEVELATQLPASRYLYKLKRAWDAHIAACDDIAQFLGMRPGDIGNDWTNQEWRVVYGLLKNAFDTDKDKTIYSSGIKQVVEKRANNLAKRYLWTSDEFRMCLTPKEPPLHLRYRIDHMKLFILEDESTQDDEEKRVADLYHQGDLELMKIRMSKMNFTASDRHKIKEQSEIIEEQINKQRIKKSAFIDTYPGTEVIDKLLEFDNWTEYLFVYNQLAYPDIHLREEVVKQARKLGLLKGEDDALSFSKDELLDLSQKAQETLGELFEMPVERYIQTVSSCGVSCVMMIGALAGLKMNRDTEIRLWMESGAPYNFPGGMGRILSGLGFRVVYAINQTQHFHKGLYPVNHIDTNAKEKQIAEQYVDMHNDAVAKGMEVINREVDFTDMQHAIRKGWFSIIGIHMPFSEGILHWILAYGYDDSDPNNPRLLVADPLAQMETMSPESFQKLTTTYMGRRFMFVHNHSERKS